MPDRLAAALVMAVSIVLVPPAEVSADAQPCAKDWCMEVEWPSELDDIPTASAGADSLQSRDCSWVHWTKAPESFPYIPDAP